MKLEIKKGDKVRLVNLLERTKRDHPLLSIGDEGTMAGITSGSNIIDDWVANTLYIIEWNKNINCHSFDSQCKSGHGGYVEPEEIEIIKSEK